MKPIYEFLFPYMRGNFIGQRLISATVFAEFINQSKVRFLKKVNPTSIQNEKVLLQQLINTLMASLNDPAVKLQSLRGLGNIVSVDIEEVTKTQNFVLTL